MFLNRKSHGLTVPELVTELTLLFQRGDLLAYRDRGDEPRSALFTPTPQEIHNALTGKIPLSYILSAQGGASWEDVSHPQWDRFVAVEDPAKDWALVGTSRDVVEDYLAIFAYLLPGEVMVPDTAIWSVEEPWQVTYWKTLPRAYKVEFRTEIANNIDPEPEWVSRRQIELQTWYTNPFES